MKELAWIGGTTGERIIQLDGVRRSFNKVGSGTASRCGRPAVRYNFILSINRVGLLNGGSRIPGVQGRARLIAPCPHGQLCSNVVRLRNFTTSGNDGWLGRVG